MECGKFWEISKILKFYYLKFLHSIARMQTVLSEYDAKKVKLNSFFHINGKSTWFAVYKPHTKPHT
jgi:hypothetical protein